MRCSQVCGKSYRPTLQNPTVRHIPLHAEPATMRIFMDWHAACISACVSRVAEQDPLRDSIYQLRRA